MFGVIVAETKWEQRPLEAYFGGFAVVSSVQFEFVRSVSVLTFVLQ